MFHLGNSNSAKTVKFVKILRSKEQSGSKKIGLKFTLPLKELYIFVGERHKIRLILICDLIIILRIYFKLIYLSLWYFYTIEQNVEKLCFATYPRTTHSKRHHWLLEQWICRLEHSTMPQTQRISRRGFRLLWV